MQSSHCSNTVHGKSSSLAATDFNAGMVSSGKRLAHLSHGHDQIAAEQALPNQGTPQTSFFYGDFSDASLWHLSSVPANKLALTRMLRYFNRLPKEDRIDLILSKGSSSRYVTLHFGCFTGVFFDAAASHECCVCTAYATTDAQFDNINAKGAI